MSLAFIIVAGVFVLAIIGLALSAATPTRGCPPEIEDRKSKRPSAAPRYTTPGQSLDDALAASSRLHAASRRNYRPSLPLTAAQRHADGRYNQPRTSDDGLATSIALGYALNDGLVGGLAGGNLVGGMIGDALNSGEHEKPSHESPQFEFPHIQEAPVHHEAPSYDHSPSHDGGSSHDSGSSYDGGSSDSGSSDCGGGD